MLLLVMMMVVVLMVKIQWFPVIWHERHTDSHFKKVLGITDLGFNCHLLTLWTWVNQGQITESQDSSKFCKTGRWTSRSRSSSNNLEICGVYFRDISKKNKITYSLSQSHNLHIQHITSKFPPKVYQGAPFVESYTKHSIIACPGAAFFLFFQLSFTPFPFIEIPEVNWNESHSVVSYSLQPHTLDSLWNSPAQNAGVGNLSLLQGIFPTQESNSGFPHCRRIVYQLSHKGTLEWVAYPFSSRSSRPSNRTRASCIAGRFFANWAIREALKFQSESNFFISNYLPCIVLLRYQLIINCDIFLSSLLLDLWSVSISSLEFSSLKQKLSLQRDVY